MSSHPSTSRTPAPLPTPRAVTRSASRRSLAFPPSTSQATADSRQGDMAPPPVPGRAAGTGMVRSRTTSSLSSSSSNFTFTASASSRTQNAIAARPTSSKSSSTLPFSRSRRVLVDSNNNNSSLNLRQPTGDGLKSPPSARRGRVSSREAGAMKGMGVVRAGPAVQGRSRSPSKPTSSEGGGAFDPFSTSFVVPSFAAAVGGFETSDVRGSGETRVVKPLPSVEAGEKRRRQLSQRSDLSDERMDGTVDAELFDIISPRKRQTPPRSPSRQHAAAVDGSSALGGMDVDTSSLALALALPPAAAAAYLAIPASSPVRGALLPRTLVGGAAGQGRTRRKLDEIQSSEDEGEEDELDFLSPRKKPAKRQLMSAPSPVKPSALPSSASLHSFPTHPPLPRSTHPAQPVGLLRSPPPKKKLPSSATVRASVAAAVTTQQQQQTGPRAVRAALAAYAGGGGGASLPMQRSGGRAFPLPSSLSSSIPRSGPIPPLSSSSADPGVSAMLPPSLSGANSTANPTLTRSTRSSTHLSASTSSSLRASVGPPSSNGAGSRLPRPAARVVPGFTGSSHSLPIPPPSSSAAVHAGDISLPILPSAPPTSASSSFSAPSASTPSSKSEETARRLANLQSMLSRLQMPASRRTSTESAGAGNFSVASSTGGGGGGGAGQREYSIPIAPPAESGAGSGAMLPPSLSRRRSSTSTSTSTAMRAAGGIVNTAKQAGAGSFSFSSTGGGGAGNVSTSSSSAGAAGRRRTSAGSASNGSFSYDSSLILSQLASGVGQDEQQQQQQLKQRREDVLRGVVAFVDVKTAEGDDSGMIFVDMLKGLGARVTLRPSTATTHIIYKSGRPSTLSFFRSLPLSSRPKLVGIAWVVRCAELGVRVGEGAFAVPDVSGSGSGGGRGRGSAIGVGKENVGVVRERRTGEKREVGEMAQAALGLGSAGEKGGAGGAKRRRSMEPKALAALNNAQMNASSSAADNALKASIAASIERARRKSLLYAPKVGSPLAKRVFNILPDAANTSVGGGGRSARGREMEVSYREEEEDEGMEE